ncbi:MAG: GAF domain-containing protein [Candidatus Omnitrophica bacterium]|nr:GAF domain-containing protein [Candidatus Omnitrophota bacterium]
MMHHMAEALRFNGYALPVLGVGVLMLLTGVFIFLQNKRSRVNFSFCLIGLCGFLWFLGIFATYSARTPEFALRAYRTLTFLGVSMIAPCVYYFSATWLGLFNRQRPAVYMSLFLGAAFYITGLYSPLSFPGVREYYWGYYPVYGPVNYFFIGFFFIVLIGAFYNFFHALFSEPRGVRKTQIGLITTGFLVSFTASFDYVPKLTYYPVYPLGFLTVFFWILVVAYAIIRYRAMDIETVIHKTLMWLLTSFVAVVPFAALVYWSQRFRDASSAWRSTLYYLAVAVTFYVYFRSIQPRLDHLFQRQRANLQALFSEFSGELVHLKHLRDLLQSFARMLRRRLYVRRISVYLLDEKRNEFVPAIAKGLRNLRPIPGNHAFLAWLEKSGKVVVEDFVTAEPEVAAFKTLVEDYFKATQSLVIVPFVLGEKLIGVAHLGRKANLRKYGVHEIQFLAQLKVAMTIAFSNSMRYEDIRALSEELQRWNVELEQRVKDRTRELEKTQEQLIQAEKLATLGTLAGGVAHEINNPLTAVLTNAQILKMMAPENVKESLDLIEEGAKRCQTIVQKLMKYARKTDEEAPHRSVDLNEVVRGTCALLGFQFRQENIRMETKLEPVPAIAGIANELEQVLTNLLVNARDAIHAAKVDGEILIETRAADDGAELIVSDNGIGVSPENQKKIFDPFFTTKDVGAGTGLGLAISFGILKRHHATLAVESPLEPRSGRKGTTQARHGKGAAFKIRFPRARLS